MCNYKIPTIKWLSLHHIWLPSVGVLYLFISILEHVYYYYHSVLVVKCMQERNENAKYQFDINRSWGSIQSIFKQFLYHTENWCNHLGTSNQTNCCIWELLYSRHTRVKSYVSLLSTDEEKNMLFDEKIFLLIL